MSFTEHLNEISKEKMKENYFNTLSNEVKKADISIKGWKLSFLEHGEYVWNKDGYTISTTLNEGEFDIALCKDDEVIYEDSSSYETTSPEKALPEYVKFIRDLLKTKTELAIEENTTEEKFTNVKDFIHHKMVAEAKKKDEEDEDDDLEGLDMGDEEADEVVDDGDEEADIDFGDEEDADADMEDMEDDGDSSFKASGTISSSLMKNLIDIITEYVDSELDVSDDAKAEINKNLKIKVEEHSEGATGHGPKFVAESFYTEDDEKKPVKFGVPIIVEEI